MGEFEQTSIDHRKWHKNWWGGQIVWESWRCRIGVSLGCQCVRGIKIDSPTVTAETDYHESNVREKYKRNNNTGGSSKGSHKQWIMHPQSSPWCDLMEVHWWWFNKKTPMMILQKHGNDCWLRCGYQQQWSVGRWPSSSIGGMRHGKKYFS